MHADQLTVPAPTVRALVDDQFPQWRELPVRAIASQGTVNAIFRIGDGLAARFPLRARDAGRTRRELEAEAQAARELAGRTRFRTPEPVALGEPGAGYPLPWSVQTWLPGIVATADDPAESAGFAHDLAEFIQGVRAIGTGGRTFRGQGRGGDLRSHDAWMEECFRHSEHLLDVPWLRRMWQEMRVLPRGPGPDVMTHGDLIPGNVLVEGGRLTGERLAGERLAGERLTGVLDVGGLGPADPALDLVGAWHSRCSRPATGRQVLRDAPGLRRPGMAERGRAWAFEQAMGVTWYYVDTNPAMSRMGHGCTLARPRLARLG